MEVNNYYPGVYPERSPIAIGRRRFLNSSLSYSRSGNRYKYQTKEVDNYFDYNILDFGARHYDPAAARWTAYDPASQFATPYIAMGGNPVSGIDPDGRRSRRLSDSQAANQDARETMQAMESNTGGVGIAGGSENYLKLAREVGIGLQFGSYSWTYYMDDNGKFYANVEAASLATGISINSINGLISGEKIVKDFNVELGPAEKSERGKHLTLNSSIIYQSFDTEVDGKCIDSYYGDIEWKLGEEGGLNYFDDTYTGPNNPIGYTLPPLNPRDAISMTHDKGYDVFGAKGPKGVITNGYVLPYDYKFIKDQFKLGSKLIVKSFTEPSLAIGAYDFQQGSFSFMAGFAIGVPTLFKSILLNPYKIP